MRHLVRPHNTTRGIQVLDIFIEGVVKGTGPDRGTKKKRRRRPAPMFRSALSAWIRLELGTGRRVRGFSRKRGFPTTRWWPIAGTAPCRCPRQRAEAAASPEPRCLRLPLDQEKPRRRAAGCLRERPQSNVGQMASGPRDCSGAEHPSAAQQVEAACRGRCGGASASPARRDGVVQIRGVTRI